MTINYEDYKRLIFKLAHTYSDLTGIEVDELISAGNEKFMTCQKTYDPDKAKFSTYLTWELRGLFREMQRKRNNYPDFIYDHVPESNSLIEETLFFKDILKELKSDAQEVAKIVFNIPSDMIEMMTEDPWHGPRFSRKGECKCCRENKVEMTARKICRKCYFKLYNEGKLIDLNTKINKRQIQRYLHRKKGWSFTRIWKSFKEIMRVLEV